VGPRRAGKVQSDRPGRECPHLHRIGHLVPHRSPTRRRPIPIQRRTGAPRHDTGRSVTGGPLTMTPPPACLRSRGDRGRRPTSAASLSQIRCPPARPGPLTAGTPPPACPRPCGDRAATSTPRRLLRARLPLREDPRHEGCPRARLRAVRSRPRASSARGNLPQAFSHLALVETAFTMAKRAPRRAQGTMA